MCRYFVPCLLVTCALFSEAIAQDSWRRDRTAGERIVFSTHDPNVAYSNSPESRQASNNRATESQVEDQEQIESPYEIERFNQDEVAPEVMDIAEQRRQTLKDWPRIAMQEIKINPREMADKVPADRADRLIRRYARNWSAFDVVYKHYCWEAPNIRYQPLYFEDVALERYGQRVINDYWQTAASGAQYFTSLILLPLHMRQDPIYSCDCPLGYCRPGTCPDRIFQRQFWGWRR